MAYASGNQYGRYYHPNSLGGCPYQAKISEGGFSSFNERVDAHKVRERSVLPDHFGQLNYFNSQTPTEKVSYCKALRFELGKVETAAKN
jgi:catalase